MSPTNSLPGGRLDSAEPEAPSDDIRHRQAIPIAPALHASPVLSRGIVINILLFLAASYTMTLAGALAEAARRSLDLRQVDSLWLDPDFLALGLPYSLCLIAILGTHEMGHYLACRHYGVDASLPYFLPNLPILIGTFGAFIRIRSPFPNRKVLFDVGVAGPLAGFAVALPVLIYGAMSARPVPIPPDAAISDEPLLLTWLLSWLGPAVPEGHTFWLSGPLMAGWVGCLATALNLFPIGQLDGGHVCYAISARFHRAASLLGLVGFAALGILVFPGYLFFAMLLLVFGRRHPPVMDDSIRLSTGRMVVAALALLILILCFIPRPISTDF